MDGPIPHDPARERASIEAAARDMGIVLGDPAYPFVQLMLRVADDMRGLPAEMEAAVQQARKPVNDEDIRRLTHSAVQQMDTRMAYRMVQFNKAGIAIGVLVALALGTAGFGAGWFTRASAEGVTAVTNCVPSPQTSGEAFSCTFWTKMPTGTSGR